MKCRLVYLFMLSGLLYPLYADEPTLVEETNVTHEVNDTEESFYVDYVLETVKNEEIPVPEVTAPSRLKIWAATIYFGVIYKMRAIKKWFTKKSA